MSDTPGELVPNCLTCRQHYQEAAAVLTLAAAHAAKRDGALHPAAAIHDYVAYYMQRFHQEHLPNDN